MESAKSADQSGPVINKKFVRRTDSRWLATDGGALPDLPLETVPRRLSLRESHLVCIVEKQQQQVNYRPGEGGETRESEVALSLSKKVAHAIKSLAKKVFKS